MPPLNLAVCCMMTAHIIRIVQSSFLGGSLCACWYYGQRTSYGSEPCHVLCALYVQGAAGPAYADESFVLPALIRFGGEPEVDEATGGLLYRFPDFQASAQVGWWGQAAVQDKATDKQCNSARFIRRA